MITSLNSLSQTFIFWIVALTILFASFFDSFRIFYGSHHNHTENNFVYPDVSHNRKQYRCENKGNNRRFHEHAADRQEDHNKEKQNRWIRGHGRQCICHGNRDVVIDDAEAEHT